LSTACEEEKDPYASISGTEKGRKKKRGRALRSPTTPSREKKRIGLLRWKGRREGRKGRKSVCEVAYSHKPGRLLAKEKKKKKKKKLP